MDIKQLNTKLQDLQTRIAKIREDMSAISKTVAGYDPKDSTIASVMQTDQQNISKFNDEAQKIEKEAERLTQELKVKQQQDEELARQENDIMKQLENTNHQKTTLEEQLKNIQGQRTSLIGTGSTSLF